MLISALDTSAMQQHQELAGDRNTGFSCYQLQHSSSTCSAQIFHVLFLCCSLIFLAMGAFGH